MSTARAVDIEQAVVRELDIAEGSVTLPGLWERLPAMERPATFTALKALCDALADRRAIVKTNGPCERPTYRSISRKRAQRPSKPKARAKPAPVRRMPEKRIRALILEELAAAPISIKGFADKHRVTRQAVFSQFHALEGQRKIERAAATRCCPWRLTSKGNAS